MIAGRVARSEVVNPTPFRGIPPLPLARTSRTLIAMTRPHLHLASAPEPNGAPAALAYPLRVLLADDHIRVRRNLRLLLDSHGGIEVVEEDGEISRLLHHLRHHAPHVIVLDLQSGGGSSLEAVRQLQEESPEVPIVVLTMERSAAYVRRALELGALAVVRKDHADSELLPAVHAAAAGHGYVSPLLRPGLDALDATLASDQLTLRESEVLRLVALGYTSLEIARQLHVSRRTVEVHRASIHRKLRLSRRAELVEYALARHLIGA